MKNKIEVPRDILYSKNISDGAKVTLLLHSISPQPTREELARLRNLPIELVNQHLSAASKVETPEEAGVTLAKLCHSYLELVQLQLRAPPYPQPNLRAAIQKVAAVHGIDKTRTLLTAFVAGCRTLDDTRIVNFYKKFGSKKLK